jgi:hypothetical protein
VRGFLTVFSATFSLLVSACTFSNDVTCSANVSPTEIEKANSLIYAYLEDNQGIGQGNAVFSTYELNGARKCSDTIVLEMAPRRARLGDTVVYSGSAVRYAVDLSTGSVDQQYLD